MTRSVSVAYTENGVRSIRTFIANRYIHSWDRVDGAVSIKVDGRYMFFPRSSNPVLVNMEGN